MFLTHDMCYTTSRFLKNGHHVEPSHFCWMSRAWMITKTYLKHLLNVVVFGLEQLTPRGQVAVGEDAAGFQHPVSVTLQADGDAALNQAESISIMMLFFSIFNPLFTQTIQSVNGYLVCGFSLHTLMKSNWWVCHVSSDRGYVSYRIPGRGGSQRVNHFLHVLWNFIWIGYPSSRWFSENHNSNWVAKPRG